MSNLPSIIGKRLSICMLIIETKHFIKKLKRIQATRTLKNEGASNEKLNS